MKLISKTILGVVLATSTCAVAVGAGLDKNNLSFNANAAEQEYSITFERTANNFYDAGVDEYGFHVYTTKAVTDNGTEMYLTNRATDVINNSNAVALMRTLNDSSSTFTIAADKEGLEDILFQNLKSITIQTVSGSKSLDIYYAVNGDCVNETLNADTAGVTYRFSGPAALFYVASTSSFETYIKSVTITYICDGGTATPTKTLDSISIDGMTTDYHVGDTFEFDGTCIAHYSNGSSKVVTPTSVTTPDMSTAGDKSVTVSYAEDGVTKAVSYDISVSEAAIDSTTKTYFYAIASNRTLQIDLNEDKTGLYTYTYRGTASTSAFTWSINKTQITFTLVGTDGVSKSYSLFNGSSSNTFSYTENSITVIFPASGWNYTLSLQ